LLSFLRKCIITLIGTDDKDIRRQQISYNGAPKDAEIWAPYGMSYNLPPDSVCLYAQVGGDSGNLVVLPDRSQDRVKDLKEGEVAFFNPLTKTRTIYRQNGDMEIVTESNEEGEGGDLNLTVANDVNLKAKNVNIDAATTNLGVGGQPIARVGDTVQVAGVQAGGATVNGTITSGGGNTSI